jgi:hypothetical protein
MAAVSHAPPPQSFEQAAHFEMKDCRSHGVPRGLVARFSA